MPSSTNKCNNVYWINPFNPEVIVLDTPSVWGLTCGNVYGKCHYLKNKILGFCLENSSLVTVGWLSLNNLLSALDIWNDNTGRERRGQRIKEKEIHKIGT